MKEIITLQVGHAGNHIGVKFWESLCEEQTLSFEGKVLSTEFQSTLHWKTFFEENESNQRYLPRTLLIDSKSHYLENIQYQNIGQLFTSDSYIIGDCQTDNNWAKGFYQAGAQLGDMIMEQIRKYAENCDSLIGFQTLHAIGAGTGSGLGSFILSKIKDEYPHQISTTISLFPSSRVSTNVIEPYNATLALHSLVEYADQTLVFDNEAIEDYLTNNIKKRYTSISDSNELVAEVLTHLTASFRFQCELNSDYRKLAVNSIPFPRLHFYAPSYATMGSKYDDIHSNSRINDLYRDLFGLHNLLCAIDPYKGSYLTSAFYFRGDFSSNELEEELAHLSNKSSPKYIDWIPNKFKVSLLTEVKSKSHSNAIMLANTSAMVGLWERILTSFGFLYSKKAYLHYFESEGMCAMDFNEAEINIKDLISEYHEYDNNETFYENQKNLDSQHT